MKNKKTNNANAEEKTFVMEERPSALFQPDILMVEEYFGNYRRKIPLEPEKSLMLSVLEDGVRSFQENLFAEGGKKRALLDEAREWLFSEVSDRIFSLDSICSALGVNAEYIRRGLKRWEEQTLEAAQNKKPSSATTPERLVA